MSGHLMLVLGGARSGKSAYAEVRVMARPGPWTYLATAEPGDGEMAARIGHHQARRGAGWRTLEAPLDLAAALQHKDDAEAVVLVDCLTLWVSNLMAADADIEAAGDQLVALLATLDGFVTFVSNEVGQGIVPDNEMARAFQDHMGRLHQKLAAVADEVVFVTAGLPHHLKGAAP